MLQIDDEKRVFWLKNGLDLMIMKHWIFCQYRKMIVEGIL